MFCPSCGAAVAPKARFCPNCGAAVTSDGGVDIVLPPPKPSVVPWVASVAVIVAAAGALVYGLRESRLQHEMQQRQAAEARLQAELRQVRKRAEDVEQQLIDAEQEASFARRQQNGGKPSTETAAPIKRLLDPHEVAAQRAAHASQAKRAATERAAQDERERRRAEEAAASAKSVPAPTPPPLLRASEPVQTAHLSPGQVCRAETNFISKAICETRECFKRENEDTAYCKSLRARATPVPP